MHTFQRCCELPVDASHCFFGADSFITFLKQRSYLVDAPSLPNSRSTLRSERVRMTER